MAGKTFKNTAGDVVDIPFKMKAVVQNGTGPATSWPATLGFDSEFQVPLLDKEPNHCLIKVVAAAITDYDISLAEGEEGDASVGEAAGTACAGIVVALGEGCKRLAINDEVYVSVASSVLHADLSNDISVYLLWRSRRIRQRGRGSGGAKADEVNVGFLPCWYPAQ